MTTGWRQYQEEAAAFFRRLGAEALVDAPVHGVRDSHNVDVLVTFEWHGMGILWIVECKHWKRRVTKGAVLTLRTIVDDVGADRGVLLSESGFQSGARAVASSTNVLLTNLQQLRSVTATSVEGFAGYSRVLYELEQRLTLIREDMFRSGRPPLGAVEERFQETWMQVSDLRSQVDMVLGTPCGLRARKTYYLISEHDIQILSSRLSPILEPMVGKWQAEVTALEHATNAGA